MKIVCESCQAKYSISDDKVRGKVFKIRCKKCSHVIVVRGADESPAAVEDVAVEPAAQGAAAADSAWHIVVDGEQVGPMPESDVRARLVRREISGDTYIWKEGLPDWLKISSLPEFAGAGAATSYEAPDGGDGFGAPPPTSVYPPGTAEDAFANSTAEVDVFSSPTAVGSVQGSAALFSSPAAAEPPRASSPASSPASSFSFSSGPSPTPISHEPSRGGNGHASPAAVGRPDNLTGQRHENSVLFSLSNLESLAAPHGSSAFAPSRPAGSAGGTQEGSGLIDIRAMAAVTMGVSSPGELRPSQDLPNFGAPQFSPVAPVLLPLNASSRPSTMVYLGLGALLLIICGMSVIIYKMLNQAPPVIVQEHAAAPSAELAVPPPAPAAGLAGGLAAAPVVAEPAKATEPPAAAAKPAEAPAAEAPVAASGKRERPGRHGKGKKGASRSDSANAEKAASVAVAETPRAVEKAAPEPADKGPAKGSIDDLLQSALGSKPRPAAKARSVEDDDSAKKPAASKALEKEELVKGMMSVMPKIKECFNQYKVPGVATVNLSIGKSGKVSSATVSGKFAGTPSGTCVEAAVKTAKFPPSDGLNVPYPVFLR